MGYHHCHLPEVKSLEEQFQKLGLEKFIKRYSKCDGLIGDSESIYYIQQKIKLWHIINSAGGRVENLLSH